MQENKSSRNKAGTQLSRIVAVMLMATFLSCHVISGTIAKYVSSGNGAADAARVASFSVEALGDDENDDTLSLRYGTDQKSKNYKINVSNHSEVAVIYTIVITFQSDVDEMLTAVIGSTAGVYDSTAHTFTWTNIGSLDIGGNADHILTITAVGAQLPTESDGTASKTTSYGFETKVLFEQID